MSADFPYLERRLQEQIQWHSDKASRNKAWYYAMEITTLGSGALIPVVNIIWSGTPAKGLSAALAALVVLSTGIGKLCKLQENWLSFRALAETLQREKELYEYGVGDYAAETSNRNQLLVERVENLIASTTSQFLANQRTEREPSATPPPSALPLETP